MAITYPVDTLNTTWAVYRISTGEILSQRRPWPREDGGPIEGYDSPPQTSDAGLSGENDDYVMLREITITPTYNAQKEKTEAVTTVNVEENTLTYSWNIIPLTDAEIAVRSPHYTTTGGIKLDISEGAQNAFSRLATLITYANMADTDMLTIKDVFGDSHEMAVSEFKAEIVGYGAYCYSQFSS